MGKRGHSCYRIQRAGKPDIEKIIMCETQKEINSFEDVIRPLMEINSYPRINWKAILKNRITGKGVSLTKWCARMKAAGLSAAQCYTTLLYEYPDLSDEMKRRAYIGVNARFAEGMTLIKELQKVKV